MDREQHYLNAIKPEYNILKIAGSRLGSPHTIKTRKLLSLNSKVSKLIFVYNEFGNFVKAYSYILSVAAITNINRLVISRNLKKNMNLNQYFY